MAVYRIYIDESGDHIYGRGEEVELNMENWNLPRKRYPRLETMGDRYLSLTGCIVEKEYYGNTFRPEIEDLKRRHFRYDPDEYPLILHRKEIVGCIGSFWRLRDMERRESFDNDLIRIFSILHYRLITVVIDKKRHVESYGQQAFHPYHYCLAALLERYCFFLQNTDSTGDVLAESRNRVPDNELIRAYKSIYEIGTNIQTPEFFRQRLTSREIKIKPKSANIAGLQVADLLAVPSKKDVLFEYGRIQEDVIEDFERRVWRAIRVKYHCNSYDKRINKFGRYLL